MVKKDGMILEKQHREGRLHPLPFWKGRGLGSGLRTPSSQEGDRDVLKISHRIEGGESVESAEVLALALYMEGRDEVVDTL